MGSVASGLNELSIKPGERIALLGDPTPYLAIAEIAAIAIGAIPVTIFSGLANAEITQILQDADPVAVVYDIDQLNISEIISSLSIKFSISCKSSHVPYFIENFISKYTPQTQWYEADPDDIALIIYTGRYNWPFQRCYAFTS